MAAAKIGYELSTMNHELLAASKIGYELSTMKHELPPPTGTYIVKQSFFKILLTISLLRIWHGLLIKFSVNP
ncbi:MAG TPA: hypothetical protein DCO83_06360 [Mucilaginibacter sp.]|jgi:hypothetical protein|nr:hypothetical protein [Mucilaginibacter sp.]